MTNSGGPVPGGERRGHQPDPGAGAVPPVRCAVRKRLLDAGLELFGTVGYEATTITDVCRQARASTRDFYRHIGDRVTLFRLVFDREASHVTSLVTEALDRAEPVIGVRTRVWMEVWIGEMVRDQRRYRVLYREAHGVDSRLDRHRRAWVRSMMLLGRRQARLCAAARGVSEPEEHWQIPVISISGGAREVLQQHLEGSLGAAAVHEVIDAYARLVTIMVEHW